MQFGTAAMTTSALVPAGFEYRPWQVGTALLSAKRCVFSREIGKESLPQDFPSSVLFSTPGPGALPTVFFQPSLLSLSFLAGTQVSLSSPSWYFYRS